MITDIDLWTAMFSVVSIACSAGYPNWNRATSATVLDFVGIILQTVTISVF
jgi:hypothetical protein